MPVQVLQCRPVPVVDGGPQLDPHLAADTRRPPIQSEPSFPSPLLLSLRNIQVRLTRCCALQLVIVGDSGTVVWEDGENRAVEVSTCSCSLLHACLLPWFSSLDLSLTLIQHSTCILQQIPEDGVDGVVEISCRFGDTANTEATIVDASILDEVRRDSLNVPFNTW